MPPRAFTGLLGVDESKDLLRAYGALRGMSDTLRARTLDAASQQLSAGWKEELANQPGYSNAQRAIVTADPTADAHLLGLTVGTGGSGELGEFTRAFEFGALNRDEYIKYTRRSPNGSMVRRPGGISHEVTFVHIVTRRTKKQMPSRSQTGWIAYPAARAWSRRVFRMFQQIIVKSAHDAVDGGI